MSTCRGHRPVGYYYYYYYRIGSVYNGSSPKLPWHAPSTSVICLFLQYKNSPHPDRILTSFGAFTLRIVGPVEPISTSSCSGKIKLLAVLLDRILAHEPQSVSQYCEILWGNGATGAHITLNE